MRNSDTTTAVNGAEDCRQSATRRGFFGVAYTGFRRVPPYFKVLWRTYSEKETKLGNGSALASASTFAPSSNLRGSYFPVSYLGVDGQSRGTPLLSKCNIQHKSEAMALEIA